MSTAETAPDRVTKTSSDTAALSLLAGEDIARRILDGTLLRIRIDKRVANIQVLAAAFIRRDGQKVLLSIMNMGGASKAAWAEFLGDLDARPQAAGERPFTFTRMYPSQWTSAITTNATECLNEEFRRRIETQTVLPCARDRAVAPSGAARVRSDPDAKGRWLGNPASAATVRGP